MRLSPQGLLASSLLTIGISYVGSQFILSDPDYVPDTYWLYSGRYFSSANALGAWLHANHSTYQGATDFSVNYTNVDSSRARIQFNWRNADDELTYSTGINASRLPCPADGCTVDGTYKPPSVNVLSDIEVGQHVVDKLANTNEPFSSSGSDSVQASQLGTIYSSLPDFVSSSSTSDYQTNGTFTKNPSNGSVTNPVPTTTADFLNYPIGVDNNPFPGNGSGTGGGSSGADYTAILNSLNSSLSSLNSAINSGLSSVNSSITVLDANNRASSSSLQSAVTTLDANNTADNDRVIAAVDTSTTSINNALDVVNTTTQTVTDSVTQLESANTAENADISSKLGDINTSIQSLGGSTGGGANPDPTGAMPALTSTQYTTLSDVNVAFFSRINSVPIVVAANNLRGAFTGSGACPALSLDLPAPISSNVSTNLHCELSNNFRGYLGAILTITYAFFGFRLLFS